MKSIVIYSFIVALLMSTVMPNQLTPSDPKSVAEALQAGSWKIYVVLFYWKLEAESQTLKDGLNTKVVTPYGDKVYYAELDCSTTDYHQVLDLFEFKDPRDNFKGRSIHIDELPMVLAVVHGVGYISHGATSYELIAERMNELIDYSSRKSVQRAY